ncbi:MAG: LuxR C-terminal-related transcriptional regulator [Novosphingobium sp.]
MSAIGKLGEFQSVGQPKSHSDRSGCRAKRKARLFVLIADDEHAIAHIKELASACIEIESLAGEHDPDGLSFVAVPRGATLRDHLTQRKLEVALGVARGLSNKDIGRELGISHFTVRNHLSQILLILGLSSRQELGEFLRTRLLRLA